MTCDLNGNGVCDFADVVAVSGFVAFIITVAIGFLFGLPAVSLLRQQVDALRDERKDLQGKVEGLQKQNTQQAQDMTRLENLVTQRAPVEQLQAMVINAIAQSSAEHKSIVETLARIVEELKRHEHGGPSQSAAA